mmetsp:Transcript_27751/g.70043  ORF Transcript_27751/g.70043 Transcript_27751/m.70043 type:complete len:677 (-) Transcript_27751:354-2384(-)
MDSGFFASVHDLVEPEEGANANAVANADEAATTLSVGNSNATSTREHQTDTGNQERDAYTLPSPVFVELAALLSAWATRNGSNRPFSKFPKFLNSRTVESGRGGAPEPKTQSLGENHQAPAQDPAGREEAPRKESLDHKDKDEASGEEDHAPAGSSSMPAAQATVRFPTRIKIGKIACNIPVRGTVPQAAGDGWCVGCCKVKSEELLPGSSKHVLWITYRGSASKIDWQLDQTMLEKKALPFLRLGPKRITEDAGGGEEENDNILGIVPGFAEKYSATVQDMLAKEVGQKLQVFRERKLRGRKFAHVVFSGFSLGGGIATLAHTFANVSQMRALGGEHIVLPEGRRPWKTFEDGSLEKRFLFAAAAMEQLLQAHVEDFSSAVVDNPRITSIVLGSVPPFSLNPKAASRSWLVARTFHNLISGGTSGKSKSNQEAREALQEQLYGSDNYLVQRLAVSSSDCMAALRGANSDRRLQRSNYGSSEHGRDIFLPSGAFFYAHDQDPVPRGAGAFAKFCGAHVVHAPFVAGTLLMPRQSPGEPHEQAQSEQGFTAQSKSPEGPVCGAPFLRKCGSVSSCATRSYNPSADIGPRPSENAKVCASRSGNNRRRMKVKSAQRVESFEEKAIGRPDELDSGSIFLPTVFRNFRRDHLHSNDAMIQHFGEPQKTAFSMRVLRQPQS